MDMFSVHTVEEITVRNLYHYLLLSILWSVDQTCILRTSGHVQIRIGGSSAVPVLNVSFISIRQLRV